LRFRDAGGTELSYWIESWDNAGDSLLWVRLPTIPSGDTDVYLYYGDPLLSGASDPHSTFLFFDGFDDHAPGAFVDQWTPAGVFRAADDGGTRVLDDTGSGQEVTAGHAAMTGVAARQRIRSVSGTIDHAGLIVAYNDSTHLVYGGIATNTVAQIWEKNGGGFVQIGSDWPIPNVGVLWHVQELGIIGSTVSVSVDGTLLGSATTGAPNTGDTGFFSQYGSEQSYRDWHLVRRLTSSEPTVSVSSEETL
jgi:hypothetical protein